MLRNGPCWLYENINIIIIIIIIIINNFWNLMLFKNTLGTY